MTQDTNNQGGQGRVDETTEQLLRANRRDIMSMAAGLAGFTGLSQPVSGQSTESGFVDILSADPSEYPDIILNVSVHTEAGQAGELSETDFTIIENSTERPIQEFSFTSTTADIVFVFDDTGSMSEEIADMKAEVISLTNDIENAGIDARYSLITFKDDIETDLTFTADAEQLKDSVDALRATRGGDEPEDNFDAIARALSLEYRSDAQKILVDITDAVSHYQGDGSGYTEYTLDEIATQLDESGVAYIAVAPDVDDSQASKKSLANETDGLWIDITSADFSRILRRIQRIVATAYVLIYVTDTPPGENRDVSCQVDDPEIGTDSDSTTLAVPDDVSTEPTGDSQTFRVMSTTDDADCSYRFTVTGIVEKTKLGEGGTAADADDSISENGDGTVTVTGSTGHGAGDAYLITGTIDSFRKTGGDSELQLYLDDNEVTDEYIEPTQTFEVEATSEDAEFTYRFTVNGSVEKTQIGDSGYAAEGDDTITDNGDGTVTVEGSTGHAAGDAYLVRGEIDSFDKTGGESGFRLYLDGEEITNEFTTDP